MRVLSAIPHTLRALITLWESYQVELRGSYSVVRLREFSAYYHNTSLLQAIMLMVVTPVPCILSIVLADVLPLRPPSEGISRQGLAYWVRTFFSVVVISITSLSQFYHSSPRLQLRPVSVVLVTLVVTTATVVFILGLHLVVGFPTPFQYQSASTFWHMMLFLCMWLLWRKTIRSDREARADLQRFIWSWISQVTLIVVYPIFSYVFSNLSGQQQTVFSFFLPFWKLALKIWANYGVHRIEDSAPVFVVFTVDVFHALFLSSAMQSSTATGSNALVIIMLTDLFQSCVAVNYVWEISRRLKHHGDVIDMHDATSGPTASTIIGRKANRTLIRAATIAVILDTAREYPVAAESRQHCRHGPSQAQIAPDYCHSVERAPSRPVDQPIRGEEPHQQVDDTTKGTHTDRIAPATSTSALSFDQTRLQFARDTLRLLHMVEFYMLIEFTEVIVPIVYSIYLVIMSQLPNRMYYQQLRSMTTDQWRATVSHVVTYAGLELLSFILLALVFRWRLGYSPTRQIAFVLHKHWCLVQSLLVLWVFFVIQMSLEHLGTDYTFRFSWLHHSNAPDIQVAERVPCGS